MSLLQELLELSETSKLSEAIEVDDSKGDEVTAECFESLKEILEDAELSLLKREGPARSHRIGGSLSANVSGAVKLVKNFSSRDYGTTTRWDYCLQVGNAIKDGNALKEVKKLYDECKAEAKSFDPTKFEEFDGVFHGYFGDGSVSCSYEYASSFCYIVIRKNKK